MKNAFLLLIGLLALVALVGAVAGAVLFLRGEEPPEWTTRSKAALEEFEQGLGDAQRHYYSDAVTHFYRALELDPDFAVAKLFLNQIIKPSSPEGDELLAQIQAADLDRLTPRERYLIRLWTTVQDQGIEAGRAVLDEFIAEYPDDLYARQVVCGLKWEDQKWAAAEACYLETAKLHPNWYEAYDRLGQLALSQGHFEDAEEHFRTYRYIAPEQASAHGALARLLIVMGRYDEARKLVDEALELKDDFCIGYALEIRLEAFTGHYAEARSAVDEMMALPACAWMKEHALGCSTRAFIHYLEGDLAAAWEEFEGDCLERLGGWEPVAQHVAVATGRLEEAERIEASFEKRFEKMKETDAAIEREWFEAGRAHTEAVRRLAQGEDEAAIDLLRRADEGLRYWGYTPPLLDFKLFNRLTLAQALEMTGQTEEATEMAAKIEEVNPRLIGELRLPGLEKIAADRQPSSPQ